METEDTFRLGPVLHSGLALGLETPGDRQYYELELRGESPAHGFSRIYLRAVSLYELLDLPKVNGVSVPAQSVRFHHQFITVGADSPIFYEWTRLLNLEAGWSGGFTLAQVKFKSPTKTETTGFGAIFSDYPELSPQSLGASAKANQAQQDAQFAGGEIGPYVRYYQLYPLVFYGACRIGLGSFLDVDAMVNGVEQTQTSTSSSASNNSDSSAEPVYRRQYKSTFRSGLSANLGVETYLGSRGVLGLEYVLWNWDFNRPQDWTHFLVLKAGFLF